MYNETLMRSLQTLQVLWGSGLSEGFNVQGLQSLGGSGSLLLPEFSHAENHAEATDHYELDVSPEP